MIEAGAIFVGSFVMLTAAAFVAGHYRLEQRRQKLLRRLDYQDYWQGWRSSGH